MTRPLTADDTDRQTAALRADVTARFEAAALCALAELATAGDLDIAAAWPSVCRLVGALALGADVASVDSAAASLPVAHAAFRRHLGTLGPAAAAEIADAYVHLQSLRPSRAAPGHAMTLAPAGGASARKHAGSFYTPPDLVERLLDETLAPMLAACRDAAAVRRLRVCDPACGSGHFLEAISRRITRRLADFGVHPPFADRPAVLLGTERDPLVAAAAAARLASVGATVRAGNALLGDGGSDEWLHACDAVVGNPPWLSYAGRQAAREAPGVLAAIVARYPAIRAWKAAHSAFLLHALALARPGGRVGLVLPLPMRYHDRYREVRAEARRLSAAVEVHDVGEQAFAGVVQAVGLFVFERNEAPAYQTAPPTTGSAAANGKPWPAVVGASDPKPAARSSRPSRPAEADAVTGALQRLAGRATFPAEGFSDPGVHSGNVARLLIRRPDDRAVLEEPTQFADVREGRDVRAYACGPAGKRLWLALTLAEGQYCSVRPLARYMAVPILLRQTASRPIAARHDPPGYFRNSLLACHGLPDVPTEVTLAVLNSALLAAWHRAHAGDAGQRVFPQVKVGHLRRLPLFDPARLAAPTAGGPPLHVALTSAVRAAEEAAAASAALADRLVEIERLVLALYTIDESLAEPLLAMADRPV